MHKVSDKTIKFLKDNVEELDSYLPLDNDKRSDLMSLVDTAFVIPLSANEILGQEFDRVLLAAASEVSDDLLFEDFDFDDFNRRIK